MKLIWILTGVGVGAALTYALVNAPAPSYATSTATGYDSVEDAAGSATEWGAKQRVKGKGRSVAGAIKKGVGKVTGNPDLQDEGTADSVVGKAKDAVGQLGTAVGETIHDLNK